MNCTVAIVLLMPAAVWGAPQAAAAPGIAGPVSVAPTQFAEPSLDITAFWAVYEKPPEKLERLPGTAAQRISSDTRFDP